MQNPFSTQPALFVTSADLEHSREGRKFCHLELGGDVPDATTIGRFRAKLVEHDLWEVLLAEVNRQLEKKRIIMTEGRIHCLTGDVYITEKEYHRRHAG